MMRGEFITKGGLILPNNISSEGARVILAAAFRNDVPTWYMALVRGVPSLTMTSATLTEPTIGTNGYARVGVARSNVGWPTEGVSAGERFIETDWITFAASGGNFNQAIQRVALLGTNAYNAANPVYALSAALPAERVITPSTALGDRQFKYRVYI